MAPPGDHYHFLSLALLIALSLSTLQTTSAARSLLTATTTAASTSPEPAVAPSSSSAFNPRDDDEQKFEPSSKQQLVKLTPRKLESSGARYIPPPETSLQSVPAVRPPPKAASTKYSPSVDQSLVPGAPDDDQFPNFPSFSPFPDFMMPSFGFPSLPFPDMPLVPTLPLTPPSGQNPPFPGTSTSNARP